MNKTQNKSKMSFAWSEKTSYKSVITDYILLNRDKLRTILHDEQSKELLEEISPEDGRVPDNPFNLDQVDPKSYQIQDHELEKIFHELGFDPKNGRITRNLTELKLSETITTNDTVGLLKSTSTEVTVKNSQMRFNFLGQNPNDNDHTMTKILGIYLIILLVALCILCVMFSFLLYQNLRKKLNEYHNMHLAQVRHRLPINSRFDEIQTVSPYISIPGSNIGTPLHALISSIHVIHDDFSLGWLFRKTRI